MTVRSSGLLYDALRTAGPPFFQPVGNPVGNQADRHDPR
jgi:hypothetical protein